MNADMDVIAPKLGGPSLVLGTAQLDLDYGAANTTGRLAESQAIELVRSAVRHGIRSIDTARAYGDAERRIGLALAGDQSIEVITKLDPLARILPDADAETAKTSAAASLTASRQALGRERLDAVLLHRPEHRMAWSGAIWRLILAERDAGRIGRLGVSVQSPAQALAALADRDVAHLQIPFNLLDHRWEVAGVINELRAREDVVVHARSVLLQGLLAGLPQSRWPKIPGIDRDTLLSVLTRLANELGRENLVDLCIAFIRAQAWINGVIIGMETLDQLRANVRLFRTSPLTPDELYAVRAALPLVPETFLDPSQWPMPNLEGARSR